MIKTYPRSTPKAITSTKFISVYNLSKIDKLRNHSLRLKMSDSVDEILERIHLQPSDLNNVGSEIINKIFTNLSVGQISRLCRMSRSFNNVCKRESLWKDKLWNDYEIDEKYGGTWRETAKEEFLFFWDFIDYDIKYYMTDAGDQNNQVIFDDIPGDGKAEEAINKFEENFANHALREEKEVHAAELIFRSFYDTNRYIDSLDDDYYYVNFIPLFKKVAELSPGGKISLRWVLNLNDIQEVKLSEIDPDDLIIHYQEYGTDKYKDAWLMYNTDLYRGMGSLISLYANHQDLFIDDTNLDQKDIVLMLNDQEDFLYHYHYF